MKSYRYNEGPPTRWNIKIDEHNIAARQRLMSNESFINHFIQGQRQLYDAAPLSPYWKKVIEYNGLKITYRNHQGDERVDIEVVAPIPAQATEEIPIVEPVLPPEYIVLDVDPVAVFRPQDITRVYCDDPEYYSPVTPDLRTELAQCCSTDNLDGGNTTQYVTKVRTGWMTGALDPFDFTQEQFDLYEQSFQQDAVAHNWGTPTAIGRDEQGRIRLSYPGRIEILGPEAPPSGQEVELEATKYQAGNIDSIPEFTWATMKEHKLFTPYYRTWQDNPGGHPVEGLIDAYYDALDASNAEQGLPPAERPATRYATGTSVTMTTTWDRLTGNYCNSVQFIRGYVCVSYPVGLFDGQVPGIVWPEYGLWPLYFGACRSLEDDGSYPSPPTMDYDMIGGFPTLMAQWSALVREIGGNPNAWGSIGGSSQGNVYVPNRTTPGSPAYYRAPNQIRVGSNTPAANIVEIPWDFSGLTARWTHPEGKMSADYQITGWGFYEDKWDGVSSGILFGSPLYLVLSKIE